MRKMITSLLVGGAAATAMLTVAQLAHAEAPPTPEQMLGALATTSVRPDSLPSTVALDSIAPAPIRAATVHKLATTPSATIFVALTQADQVCLITALNGPERLVGSNCTDLADFAARGLSSASVVQSGASAESYLFPAGYAPTAVASQLSAASTSLSLTGVEAGVGFVTVDPASTSSTPVVAVSAKGTISQPNLTPIN